MNAASSNPIRTSMRNNAPETMAPPLSARGQPGGPAVLGKRLRSGASQYGALAGFCHTYSWGTLDAVAPTAAGSPEDTVQAAPFQCRVRVPGSLHGVGGVRLYGGPPGLRRMAVR